MANVEYRVVLDDSQVLAALKNIDRNLDKLASDGDKSFQKVGKSATTSGIKIGAIAGVTQALTREFIRMAERAVAAFVDIAKGGVELNQQLETLEIRVTSIFGGSQAAAEAFLVSARNMAKELRVDYVELAELSSVILPDAGDLQASNELAGRALLLAQSIGVSADFARRSIIEALAGQYVSIRRVLNLSSQQVKDIQEYAKTMGQAEAISKVLGDQLQALGIDADKLSGSFTAIFNVLRVEGQQIQQIFAKPIFEELKVQGEAFLQTLEEHRDDIQTVARAFGEFAANVIKLVSSRLVEFIDNLDYEQLEKLADALNEMVAAGDLLLKSLSSAGDDDGIKRTVKTVNDISSALVTAAKAAAIIRAELARIRAETKAEEELGLVSKPPGYAIPIHRKATPEEEARIRAAGEEAYKKIILEVNDALEEYDKRLDELHDATKKRKEAVEEATDADIEAGEAYLKLQIALEQLAEAESEAADAQEKINKEIGQALIEHQRKLIEISINAERKRLDDAIKFAQKREDLARENLQKIEDIYRKHSQDIDDAAKDLSRDEEDIYRKHARKQQEQDRDLARERLSIETDFRRELQRIRDRFNDSAQDAERRNDAQAYLEAVRQRDRDVRDAKRSRDESLEDAATRAKEQRESLREELDQEIEDARIANRRKLEDLQERLARELEEQRINYQRQLEEQAITEQRKAEERARAYAQELEDLGRKESQRLQDIRRSLETEFDMVKEFEAKKREVRVMEAERTVQQVNAIMARLNPFASNVPQLTPRQQRLGLAGGGYAPAGVPVMVGENGPELLVPAVPSYVVPNAALGPAVSSVSTVYNNQRSIAPTFNVAEDLFNNPQSLRRLQNIILSVVAGAV